MKAGRALYFLAFVILLSARGAVFRIAAFAVHPAKPLRAISAVHVIATAAKGEVPAVFTADFGATFPTTKIQRWGFVTRITPKAFAFVAPFAKYQVARVASHVRNAPPEACCTTTQKVLVAEVAQWHVDHVT
jgi:hypothetical protein